MPVHLIHHRLVRSASSAEGVGYLRVGHGLIVAPALVGRRYQSSGMRNHVIMLNRLGWLGPFPFCLRNLGNRT